MNRKRDDSGTEMFSGKAKLVGRRRLVKVLATGGGVATGVALIPARWASPIVETVGLPAHAQTSGIILGDQLPIGQLTADAGGPSLERLADLLVPRAEAIATPLPGTVDAILDGCVFLTFDGDFVQGTLDGPFYFGTGDISGVNTNSFSIDVGPYQVQGQADSLPVPTTVSGKVIGTDGFYDFLATVNKADCRALSKTAGP